MYNLVFFCNCVGKFCYSDDETFEETIKNGNDTIQAWIEITKEMKKSIPELGELESQSGTWVECVPKSIHLRLINKAKEEMLV